MTTTTATFDALSDDRRLAELQATGLLDSPPEEPFDRITRLAERLLDVPVALISLVDERRQYFKSQIGLPDVWAEAAQTPLSHSFCQYAVATGERLVIPDSRKSPLVSANGAVEDLGVVAYAGQPLETTNGHVLGTLCVIDHQPRDWQEWELELLGQLSALVTTEIEFRLRSKALREVETLARRLHEPLALLADAVASTASVADNAEDPRVSRFAAAARSRLDTVLAVEEDLRQALEPNQRPINPAFVAVDLGERLLRAARIASASAQTDVLQVEVADTSVVVPCDSYELERALTHVLISTLQHADETQPVTASLRRTDDEACLEIASGGRPMPVADLARIVSRFSVATCDMGGPGSGATTSASVRTRGRVTTAENGCIVGTTGPDGTHIAVTLNAFGDSA